MSLWVGSIVILLLHMHVGPSVPLLYLSLSMQYVNLTYWAYMASTLSTNHHNHHNINITIAVNVLKYLKLKLSIEDETRESHEISREL